MGATECQSLLGYRDGVAVSQATTVTSTGFLQCIGLPKLFKTSNYGATFNCMQPMTVSYKLLLSTPGWNPLCGLLLRDKPIMENLFPNNFIGEKTGLRCLVPRLFSVLPSLWDSLCKTPTWIKWVSFTASNFFFCKGRSKYQSKYKFVCSFDFLPAVFFEMRCFSITSYVNYYFNRWFFMSDTSYARCS